MNQFLTYLKQLSTNNDRTIKRHSHALLKRLQELNPQDHD